MDGIGLFLFLACVIGAVYALHYWTKLASARAAGSKVVTGMIKASEGPQGK